MSVVLDMVKTLVVASVCDRMDVVVAAPGVAPGQHDQGRNDVKVPQSVEANNVGAGEGQVKRDGVQVELWIPVQAQLHGQLEYETAYGEDGDGKIIHEDHLDAPDSLRHVTPAAILDDANITQSSEHKHAQVGLVGEGESGKTENEAEGNGYGRSLHKPMILERALDARTASIDCPHGRNHASQCHKGYLSPVVTGIALPRLFG